MIINIIVKNPLTANDEISIICPKLSKNFDKATTQVDSGIPKLIFVNK
jgi:hypothetical protein